MTIPVANITLNGIRFAICMNFDENFSKIEIETIESVSWNKRKIGTAYVMSIQTRETHLTNMKKETKR